MRIKEIDIARGFTVFIIPGVHVLMMYGNETAQTSWTGKLFGFLAEGPGAPLFMFLMGMSFNFLKRKTLALTLKRAAGLFIAAYILNFLKFTILQLCNALPADFKRDYNISIGKDGIVQLLLTGDILQFAAIALILLSLINISRWRYAISLICIVVIVCMSPVSTGMQSNYLVNLFTGEKGLIFFPVFPWLVYSLSGFCTVYLLKMNKGFLLCLYTGAALLGLSVLLSQLNHTSLTANFYHSRPVATLYHLSVVLLWLWLCHIAVRFIEPGKLCRLFYWLSKNILSIYIIQWPLVCWFLPVAGYKSNNIIQTVLWMLFISGLSFGLKYLHEQIINVRSG